MKKLILPIILLVLALVFIVFWCISAFKGMSIGAYFESIFTKPETVELALMPFTTIVGGGSNV